MAFDPKKNVVKTTKMTRIIVECPTEDSDSARRWMHDNRYSITMGGPKRIAMDRVDINVQHYVAEREEK